MSIVFKLPVLLLAFLLFAVSPVFGQDTASVPLAPDEQETVTQAAEPHNLTEDEWVYLTQDSAFRYRNEREAQKVETQKERNTPNWLSRLLRGVYYFFASGIGTVLLWLFFLCLIAYIAYRIFKGDVGSLWNRKEQRSAETSAQELDSEELLSGDWSARTNEALAQGDRRLATRYLFVHLLQLLYRNGYIPYRIDATNYEYLRAIEQEELRSLYRQLLIRYEYAWFGKFPVSDAEWQQTLRLFQQAKDSIQA